MTLLLERAPSQVTRRAAAANAALQAVTVRRVRALWRVFDPDDWQSVNPWADAMMALVGLQYASHAAVARTSYQRYRLAAIGALYSGTIPRPELVSQAARTSLIVTGPVRYRQHINAGREITEASRRALLSVEQTAARIGFQGDRQQMLAATANDPVSGQWIRQIMSANPCKLCEELAGFTWETRGSGASRDPLFTTHSNCQCQAVPLFDRSGGAIRLGTVADESP